MYQLDFFTGTKRINQLIYLIQLPHSRLFYTTIFK
jgi:hypothetical protein